MILWAMSWKHYLAHTDYPIWEVIQNGNGPVSVTTDTTEQIKILPPKTAEEIVAREKERKARTTLLMAIPEDHLAKFHKMTDAKEMWNAIKSRFGGNDESKKMQKYILKQQFEGFTVSNTDGIHKGYEMTLKRFSMNLESKLVANMMSGLVDVSSQIGRPWWFFSEDLFPGGMRSRCGDKADLLIASDRQWKSMVIGRCFNSTLRKGNITHHEYIQVGKGRDVGFHQIAIFERKVAGGNGEQALSGIRVAHMFIHQDLLALLLIIYPAIYMILGSLLEQNFEKARISYFTMQKSGSSTFFTFSLGTRMHWFGRTVLHGGSGHLHLTDRIIERRGEGITVKGTLTLKRTNLPP
ncbi:ribonuclease H-like domain-containing protein [Tanacetum coccineum]